ncbi:GTP cyclohydrolase-2 [compost metagenome]
MTNNPRKLKALETYGIALAERVPLHSGLNPHNKRYLATKAGKLGHLLGSLHQAEDE